ncbi:MAG: hypothetical protein ABIT83_11015 [Massilia sp.]
MVNSGPQMQHERARSIRDIVDTSPEVVGDAWCRGVLRQLLRSVDSHHAAQLPHRVIMPDTVLVYRDGAAELLTSPDADPAFQPALAADIKALAAVMHYAIMNEIPPGGRLAGRAPARFSNCLLAAIDACLHGERTQRPQTMEAFLALLEADAPSAPVLAYSYTAAVADQESALPATPPERSTPQPDDAVAVSEAADVPSAPANDAAHSGARRGPVTVLFSAVVACVLGASGCLLYELGKVDGAKVQHGQPAMAQVAIPPAPPPVPPGRRETDAAGGAQKADVVVAEKISEKSRTPPMKTAAAIPAGGQSPGGTAYKLMIKPWGAVYVDNVRRGVSPPLKYLKLNDGQHTIRIENPAFPARVMTINAGKTKWGTITHEFR